MKLKKINQEGFTLVELMVVVAIVGILVAVAIPQYEKYQSKSRQTEAKTTLESVYTAEQSFAVENSSFVQCMPDIGAATQGNNFFYTAGFTAADLCAGKCGAQQASTGIVMPNGAACTSTLASTANASAQSGTAKTTIASLTAALAGAAPALSQSTFTAVAVGQISPSAANFDGWTINDQKALANSKVGI